MSRCASWVRVIPQWVLGVGIAIASAACLAPVAEADGVTAEQGAIALYDRLNGVRLRASDDRVTKMAALINQSKWREAAAIATDQESFYSLTLRHWANQMYGDTNAVRVPMNSFIATLLGAVRDGKDARTLLTGKYQYSSNDFDRDDRDVLSGRSGVTLKSSLQELTSSAEDSAGLLTTDAWAESAYKAGTNRRAIDFSFRAFMCTTLKEVADANLDDYRVRQDVNRAPGKKASTYQNTCRGCHAGMDALAGAFAFVDYNFRFVYSSNDVRPKYFNMLPENERLGGTIGYKTVDDSFINLWAPGTMSQLGWRGPVKGNGIRAYGSMLASSRAFSACMTKRAFTEVCRRAPEPSEKSELDALTSGFESDGYNLRRLFETIALSSKCLEKSP